MEGSYNFGASDSLIMFEFFWGFNFGFPHIMIVFNFHHIHKIPKFS